MKRVIHIQYFPSPCGDIVMASIDDELCLCDWNDWPCAERNKKRLLRYLKADFTEETSEVLENAKMQLNPTLTLQRKISFFLSFFFPQTVDNQFCVCR